MTRSAQHRDGLGVPPPQMQAGSRFPLQVLGWITSLWAFRCNRSRKMLHGYYSIEAALYV